MTLVQWLESLGNTNVRAIKVTIKGTFYEGAAYKAGWHDGEMYYLLGELPACYKRTRRTAFRFQGDSADWYIACFHANDGNNGLYREPPPFGAFVLMARWNVPNGESIDAHMDNPYTRIVCELSGG